MGDAYLERKKRRLRASGAEPEDNAFAGVERLQGAAALGIPALPITPEIRQRIDAIRNFGKKP